MLGGRAKGSSLHILLWVLGWREGLRSFCISSTSFTAHGKQQLTPRLREKNCMAPHITTLIRLEGVWWYLGKEQGCWHGVRVETGKHGRRGKREEWGRSDS